MSVMPFISAQMPTNTSSVYARSRKNCAADPEREHDHQDGPDQGQPPVRVEQPLGERLHHPQHADAEEDEAEDVGESGEGVDRVDERDDPRRGQQHAEDRPQPARNGRHRRERELLRREQQQQHPGQHADRDHRGVVELEHDERDDDPQQADRQLDAPIAREEPTERVSGCERRGRRAAAPLVDLRDGLDGVLHGLLLWLERSSRGRGGGPPGDRVSVISRPGRP